MTSEQSMPSGRRMMTPAVERARYALALSVHNARMPGARVDASFLLDLIVASADRLLSELNSYAPNDAFTDVGAINAWLDASNGASAHEDAMRVLKLTEEAGEAAAAYIGMVGQNPRKGVTHTVDDLLAELADVAITALCAIQHFTRDDALTRGLVTSKLRAIRERADIADASSAVPTGDHPDGWCVHHGEDWMDTDAEPWCHTCVETGVTSAPNTDRLTVRSVAAVADWDDPLPQPTEGEA